MVAAGRRRRLERGLLDALRLHGYRERLAEFDRELNRARRTERPLTILVLALDSSSNGGRGFGRRGRSFERYAYLFVGPVLRSLIREHDLVAYDPSTNRYVLQLTESDRRQVEQLVGRILEEVDVRTSLKLRGGLAQYPDDGLTLRELLRHAGESCEARRAVLSIDARSSVETPSPEERIAN